MFESKRDDVEALMEPDPEFRPPCLQHQEPDSKVRGAVPGVLPVDDTTLNGMKPEKLYAKDRLTQMWDRRLSPARGVFLRTARIQRAARFQAPVRRVQNGPRGDCSYHCRLHADPEPA